MFCSNCGISLETDVAFCGNCGTKQHSTSSDKSKKKSEETDNIPNPQVEKVKSFFKNDMGLILKAIIGSPIKGTYNIFINAKQDAYHQALILLVTSGLFYTILLYLFAGQARDFIGFATFLKIGITIVIILLLISTFTFLLKAFSGKPDFKKELLTGGMCGIPLMVFLLLTIIILALFENSGSIESFIRNGVRNSVWGILIAIYLLLMLINIVTQSLQASGTKDGLSWYLSPLIIGLSAYLGFKISISVFADFRIPF